MSGRKYIGTIVFNQNIDRYSKSKKESLKSEIYEKMVGNQYFIKNIELGGGQFLSHKNKTIKLKGNKAFVEFKETISPHNDTYKKRNKDKSMFNWAQKNFKKSMNFNKKMFLDDSLKGVKISVKKDNKTKKKTRKHKKNMDGGVPPILMGVGGLTLGAYGYKRYNDRKNKKEANEKAKLIERQQHEGFTGEGFTVEPPRFIPLEKKGEHEFQFGEQGRKIKALYPQYEYERILGQEKRGWEQGFYLMTPEHRDLRERSAAVSL